MSQNKTHFDVLSEIYHSTTTSLLDLAYSAELETLYSVFKSIYPASNASISDFFSYLHLTQMLHQFDSKRIDVSYFRNKLNDFVESSFVTQAKD